MAGLIEELGPVRPRQHHVYDRGLSSEAIQRLLQRPAERTRLAYKFLNNCNFSPRIRGGQTAAPEDLDLECRRNMLENNQRKAENNGAQRGRQRPHFDQFRLKRNDDRYGLLHWQHCRFTSL